MSEFATLPKLDLQFQLIGAAPAAFVRGQAAKYHADISGIFAEDGGYIPMDHALSLKVHDAMVSVMRSPEDYQRLALAALEDSVAAGLCYAEVFLSPLASGLGDPGAWGEHLAALTETAAMLEPQGVTLRGVATVARTAGPMQARKAALCAVETAGDWLTGFALIGDEAAVPPKDLAWSADCAREADLKIAVESGVTLGPDAIRDTLTLLRPDRLHGVTRLIEDLALVDELAERGLALVLCPAADLIYGRTPDMRKHPIAELDRRGLKLSIASGHAALMRTGLSRQFDAIHRSFDWDDGQFRRLGIEALDAAFCDGDRKTKIKTLLES